MQQDKRNEKIYDTGYRILEVFKLLLEKDISKNDLIESIKSNKCFENVYTKEAFIKYFNTLELSGLRIKKNKNVYHLENALYTLGLNENEIESLFEVIGFINKLHNKTNEQIIKNTLLKIVKYIDDDIKEDVKRAILQEPDKLSPEENLISRLENLIDEQQIVIITYYKKTNNIESVTLELKEIIEKNNIIYLSGYDREHKRNKKICVEAIVSIKQSPKRITNSFSNNNVIFELYGRLASAYKLRPNEISLGFYQGFLSVSSTEEDKEALIKRLLRYGENCKIIKPLYVQQDFVNLIDEMIKNLKEE